jgi:hypothetical protein
MRRGGFGGAEGAEDGFDLRRCKAGSVQKGDGVDAARGAEQVADGGVERVDGFREVGWEAMALVQEQGVEVREAAIMGAGGAGVGGAARSVQIFRGAGNLPDRVRDGAEVAQEDFGDDGVEIAEMAAEGCRGQSEGAGDVADGETGTTMSGYEGFYGF